jgi:predicted flap endonuclease-1-like 5' DNA nuclease
MNWLMLVIGLLIGWLVEWLIDVFFWRRRQGRSLDKLTACQDDLGAAKSQLNACYRQVTDLQAQLAERSAVIDSYTAPDDLTRVEGIGPKIAEILAAGGINSFGQLAEMRVDSLQEMLTAAGGRYRLANPGTWPEQARLAARGDWDKLATAGRA